MKTCPQCGCLHTDKASKCRACGTQFTEALPANKFPTAKQIYVLKYFVCIGVGIFIGLLACAAAVMATFTGCGSAPLPAEFSFVFPYSALVPRAFFAGPVGMIAGCAVLLQIPIYGVILARGWTIAHFKKYAVWLITAYFITGIVGFIIQS